jgi:DNA (cytosine-5)-methyltransferase 1
MKFIDLFAGIGGIRLAFEPFGKCVFSSEWDKNSQLTYIANFGERPFGDITKYLEKDIPEHDILLAGFPCQAFSVAGYRKGFEDTRGTLFYDVARILKYHQPKAILLENVKGLVNHDNGKTFATIKRVLDKELNYEVFTEVLDSRNYANVPQTRERIFIVGFHRKKVTNFADFKFPEKIKLTKTIHDFLDSDKKDDKYYYHHSHRYFDELNKMVTKRDTIYQWRRHYVRENKSNACPTLTANMGTGGHNVPIIRDDFGIRKLTPRECARFQGFPEFHKFPNELADSKKYYQIGNSVTVTLVKRIAKNMLEVFNNESAKVNKIRELKKEIAESVFNYSVVG